MSSVFDFEKMEDKTKSLQKKVRNIKSRQRDEAKADEAYNIGMKLIDRGIEPDAYMKKAINTRTGAPAVNNDYRQNRELMMKSLTRSSSANFGAELGKARQLRDRGGDGFLIETVGDSGDTQSFTEGTYAPTKVARQSWMDQLIRKNLGTAAATSARERLNAEMKANPSRVLQRYDDEGILKNEEVVSYDLSTGKYDQGPTGPEGSQYTQITKDQYDTFWAVYEGMTADEKTRALPEIHRVNPELYEELAERHRKKTVSATPDNQRGVPNRRITKYGGHAG